MSDFFLSERDEAQAFEDAALSGAPRGRGGLVEGLGTDVLGAVAGAYEQTARNIRNVGRFPYERFGEFLFDYDAAHERAQSDPRTLEGLIAEPDENWFDTFTKNAIEAYGSRRREWTVDPETRSEAANTVGSIARGLTSAIAGGVLGGPLAPATGPIAFGGVTGRDEYDRLIAEGVDPETALRASHITQGAMTAMGLAPVSLSSGAKTFFPSIAERSLGRFAERAVSGAALNVGFGVGQRTSTNAYLRERRYEEIAERYQGLDGQMMAIDAIFGAAFGGLFGRSVGASRMPQHVIDSAMTEADSIHRDIAVAPGIPADSNAARVHSEALRVAEEQAAADEPVDVTGMGVEEARFIPHPERDPADIAEVYRDAVRSGEIPRDPEVERLLGLSEDGDGGLMFSRGEPPPDFVNAIRRFLVGKDVDTTGWTVRRVLVQDDPKQPISWDHPRGNVAHVYDASGKSLISLPDQYVVDKTDAEIIQSAADGLKPTAANENPDPAIMRAILDTLKARPDLAREVGITVTSAGERAARAWKSPGQLRTDAANAGLIEAAKNQGLWDQFARDMADPDFSKRPFDVNGSRETPETLAYVLDTWLNWQPESADMRAAREEYAAARRAKYDEAPQLSRGDLRGTASPEAIAQALVREFGADAQRLLDTAKTEVVGTTGDLSARTGQPIPADAKGAYDPRTGKSYIVAENVSPQEAARILLHEVGVHTGLKALLGPKLWAQLLRDMDSLIASGNPIAKAAMDRVQALVDSGAMRAADAKEEAIAYTVETAPDLPFVRRLLAQIRQWLWRTFPGATWIGRLTVDDIRELAVTSLRREARLATRARADSALMFGARPPSGPREGALIDAVSRAKEAGETGDDGDASIQSLVTAAREIKAAYEAYVASPEVEGDRIRQGALSTIAGHIDALAEDAASVETRLGRTDEKTMGQRPAMKRMLMQSINMLVRSNLLEPPGRGFDDLERLLGDKRTTGRGLGQTGRREPPPGIPDPGTPEYDALLAEAKGKTHAERTPEQRALVQWDRENRPKLSQGEPFTQIVKEEIDAETAQYLEDVGFMYSPEEILADDSGRLALKAAEALLEHESAAAGAALAQLEIIGMARQARQAEPMRNITPPDDDGAKFSIGARDPDPVKQAIADEPDLTVPTERGEVRAEDALEAANENAKQAREMGKGFAAAASCAAQHGIDPIMRASTTIAAGHGLGGALAIPAGWAVANAAFRENQTRATPEYRREQGRRAVRGLSNDERFPVVEGASETPLSEIAAGEAFMAPDPYEGDPINETPGGPTRAPFDAPEIGGPEDEQ